MTDSTTNRPTIRSAAPDMTGPTDPTTTRPTVESAPNRPTNDTKQPSRLARLFKRSTNHTKATDRTATQPTKDVAVRPTTPPPTPTRPVAPTRPTTIRPTPVVVDATVVDPDEEIAPVPRKMKWLGAWGDRTIGAIPLMAPLVVSGFMTWDVFNGALAGFTHYTAAVVGLVAFLTSCALEGGLWKLVRLYERHLVAGDSTIGIRAGIGVYISVISGVIFWHAYYQATQANRELGMGWLPAAAVAIMCALGVYISSRDARWKRRRELRATGRIDRQAPKFSALAWILCPIETPKALRHAVKWRIESPIDAVNDLRMWKEQGKPKFWVPLAWQQSDQSTNQSAPTAQAADQTASESTDHTDAPTSVESTTVDTRPTAVAPTDRPTDVERHVPTMADPTRPRLAAAAKSTPRPTNRPTLPAPTHGPAAIANARILRERYPNGVNVGTVRSELGWSFDRARNAVNALNAGADLVDDTTSRPTPVTA